MDDEELQDAEPGDVEPELVEGVIVLASARTIEPTRDDPPQLRRLAAVAATGFVAGAATAAVVGRRVARAQQLRTQTAASVPAAPVEVVATRRFVVHVHTLARR